VGRGGRSIAGDTPKTAGEGLVRRASTDDARRSAGSADEDSDDVKKIRIPISIQRIAITRISFDKPRDGAADTDDNDPLADFMDRLRSRCNTSQDKAAAVTALARIGEKQAGLGDILATAGRSLGSGLSTAGRGALARMQPLATNLAATGRSALARVPAPAAVPGLIGRRLANTARFAAGVPEGQAFAPTLGQGLKNVGRLAVKPRYPLLDRPAGMAAMPRVLDRTRAALGTAGRAGSLGAMGLSGMAIGRGAFLAYPDLLAKEVTDAAGRPEDLAKVKAQMRWEAPGFYANMARDVVGGGVDWLAKTRPAQWLAGGLSKVLPSSWVNQAPPSWARQDPTSQLVRNVASETAIPFLRHDIQEARQTRPTLMGTIDRLRSTTPAGWLATQGIKQFGSEEAPPLGAAVQRHMPAFTAATAQDPSAAEQGPYAQIARRIRSVMDLEHGNARLAAAYAQLRAGTLSPEQFQQIRDAEVAQLPGRPAAPTLGEMWRLRTAAPQAQLSALRRLMPQVSPPMALAGLGKAGAIKQADFQDYVPALAGLGLGGAGGWGLGQLLGSEHPWRDTLYGASMGGLAGAVIGGRKGQAAVPTRSTPGPAPGPAPAPVPGPEPEGVMAANLAENVAPYYKDVPGGFKGVAAGAQGRQQPYAESLGLIPWNEADLRTDIPITTVSRAKAVLPSGAPAGGKLMGWTQEAITGDPKIPPANITLIAPANASEATQSHQFKEHELTHAALQAIPLNRGIAEGRLKPVDGKLELPNTRSGVELVRRLGGMPTMAPGSFEDYATSPDELDPRLALVKRLYAQTQHKDVTTPAEARDALKWFRGWIETPEGQAQTGAQGDTWRKVFGLPDWGTLEGAAARRMPGLVHADHTGSGLKLAADGGLAEILAGWKPPKENPYAGFEGFAQSFHPQTANEQLADTVGRYALMAAPPLALAGGLALWRPWERPPAPRKPALLRRRPVVKAAAVSDVANAVYSQLPRVRLPDALVGAGVGALGGLGYDWIRGAAPGEGRWRKRLGRMLAGAGVGAMGGSVVGDRFRRYVSNTLVPFGYEPDSVEQQNRGIMSRIWHAGVLDQPQYGVGHKKGLSRLSSYGAPTADQGGSPANYDYRKDTLENYILPARREIVRRQLGVHTDDPGKDWWVPGPNDQLSLNPQNPRAVAAAQRFMGGLSTGIPLEMFGKSAPRVLDQMTAGKPPPSRPLFDIGVVGGQQIPYLKRPNGNIEGSIFDRWDYTLDPKEDVFFRQNTRNMLDPAWRQAPFAPREPLSGYFRKGDFPTNESAWKALAGRWVLDNLISYKHPWITQRFRTEPNPIPPPPRPSYDVRPQPTHQIQMLTPEGAPLGAPITSESNEEFIGHPFEEKAGAADDPFDRLRIGQMPGSMRKVAEAAGGSETHAEAMSQVWGRTGSRPVLQGQDTPRWAEPLLQGVSQGAQGRSAGAEPGILRGQQGATKAAAQGLLPGQPAGLSDLRQGTAAAAGGQGGTAGILSRPASAQTAVARAQTSRPPQADRRGLHPRDGAGGTPGVRGSLLRHGRDGGGSQAPDRLQPAPGPRGGADQGRAPDVRELLPTVAGGQPEQGQAGGGVLQPGPTNTFTGMPKGSEKAARDYAPGLPNKASYGDLSALSPGQLLSYVVQQHDAERAGRHYDVRIGNPELGLLSWAARKGVPAPGEKHLAVQQPVHRHEYGSFEGEIPEGYGKGTVKTHTRGQVLITKVTPESIHFTTAHQRHPERFTLARPKGWGGKNWLLMNTTPRDAVPYEKVRYKSIPSEQVEPALKAMQEGDTAEAKVDGASQLIQLAKGHAEALSFRTSKQTGRPIFHAERLFGGRPPIPVPKHLEGSILKGEAYASPGPGRAAGPQDVGALLNSSIARSLQMQKERGLDLKNMLYDVQQYGKTPVDPTVTPRNERRRMLEEIAAHLPADKFHVSEPVHGPEAATRLWNMIRSGEHPLTEEGVVLHPEVGVPQKAKLFGEHDVVLRGMFPGEGKRSQTFGGFTYSHTPKGPIAGKVGSGLSDTFLAEAARDPAAYLGRVARLKAQQKLPSGALRAPVFLGLHEDINEPVSKLAGLFGSDTPGPGSEATQVDQEVNPRGRRKRYQPPTASWLNSVRNVLWGKEQSLLPAVAEAVEEGEEKAGAAHSALADLKRAKAESDRRNYSAKNRILSKLIQQHPGEFKIDSAHRGMVGLTHRPTGFRIHAPRAMVGGRVKSAKEASHVGNVSASAVGPVAAPAGAGAHTTVSLGPERVGPAARGDERAGPDDAVSALWRQVKSGGTHDRDDRRLRREVALGVLQPALPPILHAELREDPLRRGDPRSARLNKLAGLEEILQRIGPAVAVEGVGTGVDTIGNAINNPDHPLTSAGRALSTGLGTVGGTALGAYLGNRLGPALNLGPHTSEVGGAVTGALLGGVGGTALGRWLIPQPVKKDDRDKEAAFTTSNTATRGGRTYDIDALIARTRKRPVERIPLGDIEKPNRSSSTGYSKKRYAAVDMQKPILVGTDGTLWDGRHRLSRHLDEGKSHIRAVRATPKDLDAVVLGKKEPKGDPDPIDRSRIGLLPAKAAAWARAAGSPVDEKGAPCPPGECCPKCHARLEREPHDGRCNRCGHIWGEKRADLLPWVRLQPQQARVARKVGGGENLLVYHGLGTGKSLASLAAAEGVGGPYTAVVPASLRPNYQGEIRKFTTGTTPSEVMSYTGVGMGKQPRVTPNTVIMDEVQRIRNPESEGSRAAMNLAMQAPHRVLLSGTPIVNAPGDLAVPLSILTGKETSPAAFTKKFVGSETVHPGLWGWLQGVKPAKVPRLQNEADLERMLEGHVDYQPPKAPEGVQTHDEQVEVDLGPEQQEFYKLMWGKLPWLMRWKLSNDYPLSKQELGHLSSFMTGPRQAALSLYPYHSSRDPMYAFRTSSKLQAAMGSLKDTLARDPRAKAIVYSNFIDAGLTPYAAALAHEKIPYGQFHGSMNEEDRKRALDDYNAGRSRVLLLGPAAAEGISAKGTQLIQLLDPHWNEARMGQARGRGLRFDSHEGLPEELRNVKIQRFVAKMPPPGWLGRVFGEKPRPSADQVLEQLAHRKEELNEQFRDVLRRVGTPGYQRPWSLFG
jgi:hypothetical protein